MGRAITNASSFLVKAFRIPLLIVLSRHRYGLSSYHARNEESPDLKSLRQELYEYYDLTREHRSVRLASGRQSQVYQEVHRSRHKLVAECLVQKDRWRI